MRWWAAFRVSKSRARWGPTLFKADILTYAMYLLVPLSWWALYRTPWGLALRAIGDYPVAADSAGISVPKVRFVAVMLSCALAGLGGAYTGRSSLRHGTSVALGGGCEFPRAGHGAR